MREQLRFLHLNAVQLSKLLQENVPSFKKGESISSCRRHQTVSAGRRRLSRVRGIVSLSSETPATTRWQHPQVLESDQALSLIYSFHRCGLLFVSSYLAF